MERRISVFLLFMLSMLGPVPLFASERSQPELRIVTSYYPPFQYLEGNTVVGEHTAIIRQVVTDMNLTPHIELLPWIRAEARIKSGAADLVYSLTYSEQRAQHYLFTNPIGEARDVLFVHRDARLPGHRLADLDELKIGVSASYSYSPEFMRWLENRSGPVVRISHEAPELTGLRMVAHGRLDLFICEVSVCEYIIETHRDANPKLDRLEHLPGTVGIRRPFRAAFSRHHPEAAALREAFNDALDKLDLP